MRHHHEVFLPAVIVAAMAHWVLGAAWFTIFAKPWIAGLRMSEGEIAQIMGHPKPTGYIVALVANFGMAVVIARVMRMLGRGNAAQGARLGMMLGAGIAMLPMMTEFFFEFRHLEFALIAAAYPAVGCVLMGAIIGGWRGKNAVESSAAAGA